MALKRPKGPAGTLVVLEHTSKILEYNPLGDNVPERAARLIREQKMGPAIIVFPDCFTALGGNQYVNSSATGNYADYLTRAANRIARASPKAWTTGASNASSRTSGTGYGLAVPGWARRLRRPAPLCDG